MIDVVIVGAGPAGAVAAIVLARAGAQVRLFDRATFPRHKLCGDTLNPGALAVLERLGVAGEIEREGLRLEGMLVSGPSGVAVKGTYAAPRWGLAIRRRHLDARLLDEALRLHVAFEDGARVVGAVVHEDRVSSPKIVGVKIKSKSGPVVDLAAPMVIAADGRRSALAFSLGLAAHPARPRRFAVGAYFEGVGGHSSLGEMHVRAGYYIGVAPLPAGLTNVCLVEPHEGSTARFSNAAARLWNVIAAEPSLRHRFAGARMVSAPAILGPLAVDVPVPGAPGLLLAGDAAGFIDPMTGDGLRFAIRGGELAARAALEGLERGVSDAYLRLHRWRRREFSRKWAFNRSVRRLVASKAAVRTLSASAPVLASVIRRAIAFAGDASTIRT